MHIMAQFDKDQWLNETENNYRSARNLAILEDGLMGEFQNTT